ncbi:hypothetical protein POM88_046665 [Heracleum sosnowskyi]|uniref:Pentatricopeptide repeat-containing protein n=1 Tax=Heracleum sosnowskyi TaxID=360622 RepID=A0AAD8M687_9APIA|nr:hypothetical protein POM88_046665 [Heracleum sosnowskyi]
MCRLNEGKVKEAKELFDDMRNKELVPDANTYNPLVEGHCRVEDFSGAYFWYREMSEKGIFPGAGICNELISGLRDEGRSEYADIIYSEMKDKGLIDSSTAEDLSAVAKL